MVNRQNVRVVVRNRLEPVSLHPTSENEVGRIGGRIIRGVHPGVVGSEFSERMAFDLHAVHGIVRITEIRHQSRLFGSPLAESVDHLRRLFQLCREDDVLGIHLVNLALLQVLNLDVIRLVHDLDDRRGSSDRRKRSAWRLSEHRGHMISRNRSSDVRSITSHDLRDIEVRERHGRDMFRRVPERRTTVKIHELDNVNHRVVFVQAAARDFSIETREEFLGCLVFAAARDVRHAADPLGRVLAVEIHLAFEFRAVEILERLVRDQVLGVGFEQFMAVEREARGEFLDRLLVPDSAIEFAANPVRVDWLRNRELLLVVSETDVTKNLHLFGEWIGPVRGAARVAVSVDQSAGSKATHVIFFFEDQNFFPVVRIRHVGRRREARETRADDDGVVTFGIANHFIVAVGDLLKGGFIAAEDFDFRRVD